LRLGIWEFRVIGEIGGIEEREFYWTGRAIAFEIFNLARRVKRLLPG